MSQQEEMMPQVYGNFPSHLFSAFVYLKRQNCLSRPDKILIDPKTVLEKQRQQSKGESRGRAPLPLIPHPLPSAVKKGEPAASASSGGLTLRNPSRWNVANDNLEFDPAQLKRCVSLLLASFKIPSWIIFVQVDNCFVVGSFSFFELKKGWGALSKNRHHSVEQLASLKAASPTGLDWRKPEFSKRDLQNTIHPAVHEDNARHWKTLVPPSLQSAVSRVQAAELLKGPENRQGPPSTGTAEGPEGALVCT